MTGFPGGGFASQVGGFVFLFAGVAIIASIAIFLLRKQPQRWALPALVAVVAAWSLPWFGGFSAWWATRGGDPVPRGGLLGGAAHGGACDRRDHRFAPHLPTQSGRI